MIIARFQYIAQACHRWLEEKRFTMCRDEGEGVV